MFSELANPLCNSWATPGTETLITQPLLLLKQNQSEKTWTIGKTKCKEQSRLCCRQHASKGLHSIQAFLGLPFLGLPFLALANSKLGGEERRRGRGRGGRDKAGRLTPSSTIWQQPAISQSRVVESQAIFIQIQDHDPVAQGGGPIPAAVLCIDDGHVVRGRKHATCSINRCQATERPLLKKADTAQQLCHHYDRKSMQQMAAKKKSTVTPEEHGAHDSKASIGKLSKCAAHCLTVKMQ